MGKYRNAFLALLSISGFTFWFFLAFPFSHHHESYRWIVLLKSRSFVEWLSFHVVAATFRPLGQITAYVSYRASNNSIYPIQLLNYCLAAVSWLIVFFQTRERASFALISCTVGGALFSGYIYLFHIHGVFYSPLLLLLALMITFSKSPNFTVREAIALATLAVASCLFHPFAILLYLMYLLGTMIEGRMNPLIPVALVNGAGACAVILILSLSVGSPGSSIRIQEKLEGWTISYRMVEVHTIVGIVGLLLTLLAISTVPASRTYRMLLSFLVVLLGYTFKLIGLPLVVLWPIAILLKTLARRQWTIFFLTLSTFSFPVATGVGSPTYTVFVFFVCSYVTSLTMPRLEKCLEEALGRLAAGILTCLTLVVLLLRSGVDIPVVSRLTRPLLAEKEKTFQLERILEWWGQSELQSAELKLGQRISYPRDDPKQAIDRRYRPPTNNRDLGEYIEWRRSQMKYFETPSRTLVVLFGGEEAEGGKLVYVLPGRYADSARVYEIEGATSIDEHSTNVETAFVARHSYKPSLVLCHAVANHDLVRPTRVPASHDR